MNIGPLNLDKHIMIIAEIGNNHEGDFNLATDLIHLAAEAGADAVKFQTIVPERLVSPLQTQRIEQLRRFQFSHEQFSTLAETANYAGIQFLSTPFDIQSAIELETLVAAYKIASGDNNFFPLLETVAQTGKPILLSTGMANIVMVEKAKYFISNIWQRQQINPGLVLLHCVSAYPTPTAQANLLAIQKLKTLGVTVGYSDHTLGINAAILAVALGARVIEKHFTLSKTHSNFRDHQLSADPVEFKQLTANVREAELLLGDGDKNIMTSEKDTLSTARRSICAAKDLPSGHTITLEDLTWLRPGGYLPPGSENNLLGRQLIRPLAQGGALTLDQVK